MPKAPTNVQKLQTFLTGTAQGRSYSVVIATTILLLLVIFVGIVPSVNATLETIVSNNERQEVIVQLEQKIQNLQSLQTQVQEKQDLLTLFNSSLPENVGEEGVVSSVTELAGDNGLQIQSISFSDLEKKRKIPEVFSTNQRLQGKYVVVVVSGEQAPLQQFVSDIETSKRVFNIRNFVYQLVEQRGISTFGTSGPYILTIRAEVFYWDRNIEL